MIKLIGIALMAVGFALRINPLVVVFAAGVATALVAGFSFTDVVAQFGALFVENRYMMMPVVLLLPLIGMLEHHGLQNRAETLIKRAKAATPGRVILLYSVVRQISISLGVRIGEHASMVRPLVVPMAEGAAMKIVGEQSARTAQADPSEPRSLPGHSGSEPDAARPAPDGIVPPRTATLDPAISHLIRAHAAAGENVANFFGEDIFVAVGAVLLMNGFFQSVGMTVSLWAMALWGLPTAIAAFLLMWWRVRVLDRRIAAWARRPGVTP